jgi:hypothetical protein
MKKSILFLVAIGFLMASCTQYTCPTYAKKDKKGEQKMVTEKI